MAKPSAAKKAPPAPPPSRRVRKRERTRALIQDVAMRLFREKGFDDVTIAEIAEAADVDVTTFWRHFGSKHALLYADSETWLTELRAALEAAPKDRSAFESAVEGLTKAIASIELPAAADLRAQVLRSDPPPEVHAAILVYEELTRQELESAIAKRLKVDPDADARPAIVASAIMSAARWLRLHRTLRVASAKRPDLARIVRSALALVR